MKANPLFYPLFSILFICSCNEKKATAFQEKKLPVKKIEKLVYKYWPIDKYADEIDIYNYKSKLLYHKGQYWYCILNNKKGFFQLFNVENPELTDSLVFPRKETGFVTIDNQGNSFSLYYPEKDTIELYQLTNGKFLHQKSIPLPVNDPKNVFLRHNYFEFFNDSLSPSLIFSYAIHKSPKTSYKDTAANFLLLTPNESIPKKIGRYPSGYFNTMKYYYKPVFTGDGDSTIYYTFELHDSIYKIDKSGKLLAASSIGNNNFIPFDWKKEMDLAYVRKYTQQTERNERIFYSKNHFIVILKKLAKKEVIGNSMYKYAVLDTNLNLKYTDTIRHYCYPWFISDYKNGFLLLGDSLKSAYYYEIN